MKFRALKNFSSIRLGNIRKGDLVDLDKGIAKQMVDAGFFELTEEAREALREKVKPEPVKAKPEQDKKAKK